MTVLAAADGSGSPGFGGIAETAYAPLVARALAPEIAPDFGFRDRSAEAIYRSMQPELEAYRGSRLSMLAVITSTWVIDHVVGSFTSRHPHAQIVDLGAGLSTRFQRIDNGMLTWIDVDVPEIIALRETLFPFCDRRRTVGVEVGSPGWMDRLALRRAPTLVVAEGMFNYLPAASLSAVLADFAGATGRGTEVLHDFFSRHFARRLAPCPSVDRRAAASVRGIRRGAELVHDGWDVVRVHHAYEAMGLPFSLIGPVLRRLTGVSPHGVAHLVCTAAPARTQADEPPSPEAAAPRPPNAAS